MSFMISYDGGDKSTVTFTSATDPTAIVEVVINAAALAERGSPKSAAAKMLRRIADRLEEADWPPVEG